MKKYMLIILLLIPLLLMAETHYVDINGGQDFITIGEAVTAAENGDSIIVYPGVYPRIEQEIDKKLIIASLEMTTGDKAYIAQTIIDGEFQGHGVRFYEGYESVFRGFTVQHCISGVEVVYSIQMQIKNCIIKNNNSFKLPGAGLAIANSQFVTLSGLSIHDNQGSAGAGLALIDNLFLTFDQENKCSIYNNIAAFASDIISEMQRDDLEVIVDTISVENPSEFYVLNVNPFSNTEFTFSYDNHSMEEIDHDLYVAPNGDDDNDGLTAQTPLKTIQIAVHRIKSNPENPRTIHLAAGDYSHNLNEQIFPFGIKSNVNIIGSGEVNIWGDQEYYDMFDFRYVDNSAFENINLYVDSNKDHTFDIDYSSNFSLKNVNFRMTEGKEVWSNLGMQEVQSLLLENVSIKGFVATNVSIGNFPEVTGVMRNCKFEDNYIIDSPSILQPFILGVKDYELGDGPALIMENCIFQNNNANNNLFASGDQYWSHGTNRDEVIFNNVIFANNEGRYIESNFLFAFGYGPDRAYMNNCAFIDNVGVGDRSISIAGNFEVNNCIFHNDPLTGEELRFPQTMIDYGYNYPYPTTVTLNNCAIQGGEDSFINLDEENNVIEFNNTIDLNDYDLEDVFTYQDSTNYLSYQLKDNSPLINTGYYNEDHYMPEVDILGFERVYGSQIDIGPFENGNVSVQDQEELHPLEITEIRNYPNPFRPGNGRNNTGTTISFNIPSFGDVKIEIFNIKGQKVKTLRKASMLKGNHEILWKGFNDQNYRTTSGIYFCKISLDNKTLGIHKMLLIK